MVVEIRKLEAADLPAFKALRLEALQANPESFGSYFEREAQYEDEKFEQLMVNSAERYILGAFEADELVSMIGVFNSPDSASHIVAIWGVFTKPEFRGKGISKQLILQVIANAKSDARLSLIQLGVTSESAAAAKLYKSVGFETYKVETDAIVHGDFSMCEILMKLEV